MFGTAQKHRNKPDFQVIGHVLGNKNSIVILSLSVFAKHSRQIQRHLFSFQPYIFQKSVVYSTVNCACLC